MRGHPLLIALLGYLLGSFFGLSTVLGMLRGVTKPAAVAA
jgi:hypothetical protein